MNRYRRKPDPEVVAAVQWQPGVRAKGLREFDVPKANGTSNQFALLTTVPGITIYVGPGDYIVTGEEGERYVLPADTFAACFEPVAERDKPPPPPPDEGPKPPDRVGPFGIIDGANCL